MSLQSAAMEKWKELINQPTSLQLYVTLAVLSVTTLLFLLSRFLRQAKSNTIVLAGLNGSGKTVIFYQLRDGSSHQGTVTSMDPNEGTFILHSESDKKGKIKPVHIVDVPGHSRLRPKLDEFLPEAAGVIFIVDALDFLPNVQAVAEYIYDILTKASIVKRKTPVLVVCNKTDKVTAHSKEFIRKQLERELDKLRASRNAISAADIANEFMLGEPGQPFAFSQCHNKVTVTDASGMTGEISQIEHFIREHVTEHLFKSVRISREIVIVLRTLLSLPYEVKRWSSTVCFCGCLGCQSGSNRRRLLQALSEKGFPDFQGLLGKHIAPR